MQTQDPVLVGVTGASGALYAVQLVRELLRAGVPVEAVCTQAGEQVLRYERQGAFFDLVPVRYRIDDFFAKPASGTAKYRAMVVVPCSMGTLGKMAGAIGDNLLTRAADVFLKERRPLVIVPREMPVHAVHLENMACLARLGAVIVPASPFFYHHPESMEDLAGTVTGKILDTLGIEHSLYKPWRSE